MNGSFLNSPSGVDHTLASIDDCTRICHCKPGSWRSDSTLHQVIVKGLVWLEAYEVHMRTGHSLHTLYLQTDESLLLAGVIKEL